MDKVLHFGGGAAISGGLIAMGVPPHTALAIGIGVGFAKEALWDYALKRGTPDSLDFYATAAGSALGTGLGLGITLSF